MKKNIHKKLRNKFVHFLRIALLMGSIVTSSFLQPILTASAASDITPQYTKDSSGTSPTNSWTIPGQSTVINHQGGDTTTGWDKNSSWSGDPTDTTNSYIKYGTDTSNPDLAIRKYAKETNTPGLYDLYLNVRGNQKQTIKPIDVVLVVDMSGSMESNRWGTNRAGAVRTGVKNFLTSIQNAGLGNYVNVGLIGFSSPRYIGGNSGYISVKLGKAGNASQQQAINGALRPRFHGGTYTQIGLRQGSAMLNADTSGNKKMMILLTDGVPTFSNKVINSEWINGTLYGTNFGSRRDEPGNTARLRWPYIDSSGHHIYDTWPATLGEAKIAKDSGNEVHALGIQLGNDDHYMTKEKIRQNMQLITNSPDLYEDADSADAVEAYLNNQAKDIIKNFNTVTDGTITDPIGTQFQYANNQATVTSVGKQTVPASELPSAAIQDGQLTVNHMNLGKDQEVQIHYQERINTESKNFVPDKWYQMNGKTTFTPTKDSNAVEFGVPSAKAPGTAIKVTKQWQELVDSSKRPDSINFNVTRTVNNQSTNWQASGILSKSDDWTKTFKQLSKNNQSVWLPAYDNNGNTFNYQVSSEATDGYISSIANKTNESTITNTQYGLIIDKYASNSTNKLTGAEFIVKSADGKQSYTLKDNQLQQLSPGDYTIQEIKSPTGYQLDSTVYPITLSQDGKWSSSGQGVSATSPTANGNGYKDGFSIATDKSTNTDKNNVVRFVKNDALKKFDLTVNKVDKTTGNALKGAKFTLTDSAGKTSSYKETDPTATFTFENLSSGTYTLKETKAPDGYITSQDVTIVISDNGNVNVTNNNGDWKSTLQNDAGNNQISLTVNNTNKTVFPSTGGSGSELYLIVGGAFILISALAGGYYVFRIKRGYQS